MGLYSEWKDRAEQLTTEAAYQQYWNAYFTLETDNYRTILSSGDFKLCGKISELADRFNMDAVTFCGFLDGVNTSLKEELDLDALSEDTELNAEIDPEKLYYNMLAAKAPWLYGLKEWDGQLSAERRHEITKEFRAANIFVSEKTVGRNDPCPCGSGKKYKKCCGK